MKTISEILQIYKRRSWWDDGEGKIAVKSQTHGYDWYSFCENKKEYIYSGNTKTINRKECTFHNN